MKNIENKNETSNEIVIWIIEDNLRYRKSLAGLIERTPNLNCAKSFSNCEEALIQSTSKETPNVILLDIGLPGMSGIDAIEKFKEIYPNVFIIILTIYDDNDKVFNALCAGASGYLLKDSSPEKIIDSIKEVVDGGAPMNMQIAHKILEIFSSFKIKKPDYGLTVREKEILQLLVAGFSKQQIADKIYLSFHTVNTHVKKIYIKLHVNSCAGAVTKVYKEHIL